MTGYTHRVRRCKGNQAAWALVALNDRGDEIEGAITTAMSLDALLQHSKGLLPEADDVVQIIYA